jgi:hypothetical protein
MKTKTGSLLLALYLAGMTLAAQTDIPGTVAFESLPTTIEDFLSLRDSHGYDPSGATALFVAALLRYSQDQAAGLPMLVSILVNDNTLMQSAAANRGYRGFDLTANTRYLVDRILPAPWIAASYLQGTNPAQQYRLPQPPYRFKISSNQYSQIGPDEVRIFIESSGADSPRPLRLKRNSAGLWKVAEFSSLVVGVRQPSVSSTDDL